MTTSTQRPPLHNGHLYTTTTSTQRPPLHNDHLYITTTSTQRPPLHNDHLYTTTTSTQLPPLHNGHLYTTATSTQRRPPLHNDHLYTTTTSTQRPPLHNDHLYTTTTSTQRPPLHNDHLYTTTTSTQRPPLHNDHLYTTTTSTQLPPLHNGHLYTTATSTQRPPLHNDHLYTTTTSTQRPPLHNDHLYTTTTSTQRPPLHNDHLYTTTTSTQRPPLHNDHLYTTTTSTQRPPLHNGHLNWICESATFSCQVVSGDISSMKLVVVEPGPTPTVISVNTSTFDNLTISNGNTIQTVTYQCLLVLNDLKNPVAKSQQAKLTIVKPSFPKCTQETASKVEWSSTAVGGTNVQLCPGNATAEVFSDDTENRVVSLVYKTLNSVMRLHKNDTNTTQADVLPSNTTMVTSVVRPAPIGKLKEKVKIVVKNKRDVEPVPPQTCVFWREGLPSTWSTDGCSLVPSESNKDVTTCECDHLTVFAALMDPYGGPIPEGHRKALELISTIGCSISLFAVLLTIVVTMFFWKTLKAPRTIVLMNICVAIAVVCGLVIAEGTTRDTKVGCTVLAVLLHYFLLAVFCWMLCEGVLLYLLIVKVIGAEVEEKVKFFLLFGWGFPLIIVGISLAVTQTQGYGYYGDQTACWLAVDNGLIWAFIAPAIVVLLINMVVFILVIRQMLGTRHVQKNNEPKQDINNERYSPNEPTYSEIYNDQSPPYHIYDNIVQCINAGNHDNTLAEERHLENAKQKYDDQETTFDQVNKDNNRGSPPMERISPPMERSFSTNGKELSTNEKKFSTNGKGFSTNGKEFSTT
ncbi:hypothetical protein QZH41_005286 [Actinostola sp. cb2023]|nr:hypothetical protein QZH41_005286 [Actinostola sp. cb2023]